MKHVIKQVIIIGLFFSIVINSSFAQFKEINSCYFDEYTNNKSIIATETMIQRGLLKAKLNKTNDTIRVIPVVVHVLHTGGTENISDAQIQSQITIMNEDYGKLPGTLGDGSGVDTKVRFCLAKIDPNGKCTNGIVRINTPLANHQTYQRAQLKQLSFWDNTRYMNIYIVKTINGGVLGYSSFPGGPADEDGMVMKHSVFGKIGTASGSLGRTASHEIGHWFGLYHTFNNGCGTDLCLDGDYVCDTPPQASPSFNCSTLNTCNNDFPDVNDQKENYMNYTNDACKNMFTQGQKDRIQATLTTIRTNIWSEANLISTGCDSAYVAPPSCPVVADFVTLTQIICFGNNVRFMDISLNDATSWQWAFPGGLPTSSIVENPTITYSTIGNYDVQLIVSNGTSTDTLLMPNYISVSNPGVGDPIPFAEDFDSGIFPPQNIVINNPDGGVTWGLDSAASVSGNYSVKIDNYINTNYGSADEIILPYFDLSSLTSPVMTFKWAYAKSDPSFTDELIVLLSTDCGSNFTQIFYKSNTALATGPTQTTPFIPDSTQWRDATISLNSYSSAQYVRIKIVNITDGGNNLYIDDINITGVTGIETLNISQPLFEMMPNPAKNLVNFRLNQPVVNGVQVLLYNSIGKEVASMKIGQRNNQLNISHLSGGIYFVKLTNGDVIETKKLMITQ